MTAQKMHEDEVSIDVHLVRRLLAEQFPDWSELPLAPVDATGTVNAVYRLGDDLCVRLPRLRGWAEHLEKELEWLPRLAPRLPLAVPEPVATGSPGTGYAFRWAVCRWINGETFAASSVDDERVAAGDLAHFVTELRRVDPTGGVVDTEAVTIAWEAALRAPTWDGRPVWRHCDLLPPNLLVENGRISAVLDFGGVGIGDPAFDVIPAWSVFGEAGRACYRDALDIDDGTWARARGFALHQALLIIPYYAETNAAFAAMAARTVAEVLTSDP